MRVPLARLVLSALLGGCCLLGGTVTQKNLSQYAFHVLDGEPGLPEGAVEALAQTADGYLWLGTEEGLTRYDGARFSTFDHASTPELRENRISALAVSPDHSLWIGTRGGGLSQYRDGAFHSFAKRLGPSGDMVLSLYADRNNAIWIGTEQHGLIRMSSNRTSYYGPEQGLPARTVSQITSDSNGVLWLCTDEGAFTLAEGKFRQVSPSGPVAGRDLHAIGRGPNGSMWLGYSGGLLLHSDGHAWTRVESHSGIPNDEITSLLEDSGGGLWIGTASSGLIRYQGGQFSSSTQRNGLRGSVYSILEDRDGSIWTSGHSVAHFYEGPITTIGKPEGLASDLTLGVFGDRRGNMWIGTDEGLASWSGGVRDRFSSKQLPDKEVFSITQDRAGDVWAGTRHGVARIHGRHIRFFGLADGLPSPAIFSLFTDRDGRVWAGSHGGLSWFDGTRFRTFRASDGLPSALVTALYQDGDGALWIGTDGSGLVRLKDGRFTNWPSPEVVGANSILGITGDPDGTLWMGTGGAGLLQFRAGKFTVYGRAQGIPTDEIGEVLDDGAGALWLAANKGLFRVAKRELIAVGSGAAKIVHARRFDTSDGMRSHECNGGFQPAGWKTLDGSLWFPTMKGIAVVDPVKAGQVRKIHPATVERVLAGDQNVEFASPVSVSPKKRSLTFEFTYPEYRNPADVEFRYMLDGFDRDWVQAEHRRAAFYTNLPPGDYVFRVVACIDGICGAEAQTATLTLTPSLYERKGFWIAIAGLLAAMVFLFYRLRIRQLQARQQRLVELVESKTHELRESRDQLEIRVQERTEDLQRLNLALSSEIEVRRDAEDKAEAASQAKTEFLTNMSHELRTPINGIMGMADLTMMTPLSEEQSEYLGIIRQSADALLGIVTDILDFSNLDSSQTKLHSEPFYLAEQLQRVCEVPRIQVAEKRIAFVLDVDERIPQLLVGDATRLRKVLASLLDNAVKFTEKGSIELRLELEGRGEESVMVCFSVRDTGVGVPLEKQSEIFNAFSQADSSSTRQYGGTGLGLSICSRLVHLMQGRLWMRSEPGNGSVFCFSIPLELQKPESPMSGETNNSSSYMA